MAHTFDDAVLWSTTSVTKLLRPQSAATSITFATGWKIEIYLFAVQFYDGVFNWLGAMTTIMINVDDDDDDNFDDDAGKRKKEEEDGW